MKPSDLGFSAERFPDFRRYTGFDQLNCALQLATAPEVTYDILNAPTGTGKSLTYSAAAKLMKAGRWLVLVGTKGLQSQLLNDGLVERAVYGHRNYSCASRIVAQTSDADADDPEFRCGVPRDKCQYNLDVDLANGAESVVTNYAYWLSIGRYSDPGLLGEFDLLILDEAHGAGNWLTKAVTVYLSGSRLKACLGLQHWPQIPNWDTIGKWHEWAREMKNRALDRLDGMSDKDPNRRRVMRLVDDLRRLTKVSHPNVKELGTFPLTEPWIVIPGNDSDRPSVEFSPRWGKDFANGLLFRGIEKVVLASATVTRQHAKYLGVPESAMRYTEVPSPFDARRRPVISVPVCRVDFRMSEGAKWKLNQQVDKIIGAAIEQGAGNGIVHTGSYERTRELVVASKYRPAIISHRQDPKRTDRVLGDLLFEEALEKFKQAGRDGRFAVLVTPRAQEGVDLPGDLCRWQAILKVPFPYSLDPLTKARAADPGYRNLYVAEVMMQMCGRPVRGADDFATTFMLDEHWRQHAARNSPFPGWFRAGFMKPDSDGNLSLISVASQGEDGEWEIKFLTKEIVDAFVPMTEPVAVRAVRQVQLIGG